MARRASETDGSHENRFRGSYRATPAKLVSGERPDFPSHEVTALDPVDAQRDETKQRQPERDVTMATARQIAGLILLAALTAACGCGTHHRHGILHPRDYGTIGTTPHCISGNLIRDPLFYGHRPTRWRQWPSDYITWRYSTSDGPLHDGEELIVVPETPASGDGAQGEELPAASDPFSADEPAAETPEPNIDRLPEAPSDANSPAPIDAESADAESGEAASDDLATPPDPLELDASDILDATDE